MSALEQVKAMKSQGLSEPEIIQTLQEQGLPYREISEALAQDKIKAAVEEPVYDQAQSANSEYAPSPEGMQKSIMQSQDQPMEQQYTPQQPQQAQPYQEYAQDYQQYEQYAGGGISSETITEISEQVVAERMSEIRKHLNKVIDFKTSIETKTESIEERLKRIEKIIDTLQASVLKKVGDQVNNIEDIKRELIETQKSFSKVIPELSKHKSHHTASEHHSQDHHSTNHQSSHKKHKK